MNIGPSFVGELKAAGISPDGISWSPDGVLTFADSVAQATRDATAAVLAVHDATKPALPSYTPAELELQAQAALNAGGNIDLEKLFKAKFISDLAFRLGVAPGALTPAQLTAERNRIAAIYKAI